MFPWFLRDFGDARYVYSVVLAIAEELSAGASSLPGRVEALLRSDPQAALLWMREGWQLGNRPFDTREEAEKYRDEWQQHPEYPLR